MLLYKSRAKEQKDMAYKLRNREVFRAEVNGKNYTFTCYTQYTSYGFRHVCCEGFSNTETCRYIKNDIIAKATYYNRTWESFRYETVLRKAIEQQPKEDREQLKAILIDKTVQENHERCEKEIKAFENLYNQTSDRFKDVAQNIVMNDEKDMQIVKGIMLMDIMMNR